MIEDICCTIEVPESPDHAFMLFTERLFSWWPREYSWGGTVLEDLGMEPRIDGLCYERGPHGFRCDWGRIVAWEPERRVAFLWQISPRREPQPDPARASMVEVTFDRIAVSRTRVTLVHREFAKHGDGAGAYRAAMASPDGWPRILGAYGALASARADAR